MILRLSKIKKEYKINKKRSDVIFNNLNLSFKSGEFVCVLGESGSGKSTLMNIIGGLDLDYKGKVLINDMNIKNINLDDYRRDKIGFIFQNFNLISNLSALENVMLKLDMTTLKKSEKIKKAKEILKKLGLENVCDKKPNELSGGQKQRLAIARILVTDPDIILADEPTGSLDTENSKKVLEILKQISSEGKLVIVVTHSKMVLDYSSRVITINDGEVLTDEVIKDTYQDKKTLSTKKHNISKTTSIKFAIRNLCKNLKRNILISLASSIGIIGIIISLYIGDGVKDFINEEINNKASPKILDIKKKDKNDLYETSYFSKDDINNILNIKNIKKLYKQIIYTNSSAINYNNEKYDLVTLSSYTNIKKDELYKGNIPKENEIIISKYLADKISNKKDYSDILGKNIILYIIDNSNNQPFMLNEYVKISGIYKRDKISIVADCMYAYISYDTLNNIYIKNNKELMPTDLSVEVYNKNDIEKVKQKINNLDFNATSTSNIISDIYNYLDIATFILSSFSLISLVVSSIMIIIIMHINVVERTKEIGILRSLGASKKDIKTIFKSEAFCLGFLIGLLSFILSIIISIFIKGIIYDNFKIKFINIKLSFMIFGLVISIIMCIISSLIPANKASKIDPINALRYE